MRIIFLLSLFACRSNSLGKDGTVVDDTVDPSDTGPGVVIDPPSDDTAPPVEDPPAGPIGTWSSCDGSLTLSNSDFTWQNTSGSCSLGGERDFSDGTLFLRVEDFSSCTDVPWWLSIFDDATAAYTPIISGTRLTMVPLAAVEAGRVAQFEEMLSYERWVLSTPEGYSTSALLCSADGTFFAGSYRTIDDSCEFLSCGGRIDTRAETESGEIWTTTCGGECPCGAVVTIDSISETSMSGTYNGYNCGRVLEGSFTGENTSP